MVELYQSFGLFFSNGILGLSQWLTIEYAPGLIAAFLLLALLAALCHFGHQTIRRKDALDWLHTLITAHGSGGRFSENIEAISAQIEAEKAHTYKGKIAQAWAEYRETLLLVNGRYRNAVRPQTFINIEDLGYEPGFYRIVPGLFVTTGLLLTFLGLVAALSVMDDSNADPNVMKQTLDTLLDTAAAKFIMSLTGLFCSLVFTIALRTGSGMIEYRTHAIAQLCESQLTFISLEEIAKAQLTESEKSDQQFKDLTDTLVTELGQPLRQDIPNAIATSISDAVTPLIEKVTAVGTEAVVEMVSELSDRFSKDVSHALKDASATINDASQTINHIAQRMEDNANQLNENTLASISHLDKSVKSIQKASDKSVKHMAETFTQHSQTMQSDLTALLTALQNNTTASHQSLSESMDHAVQSIQQASDTNVKQIAETFTQHSQAMQSEMSTLLRALQNTMTKSHNSMAETMDHAVQSMNDTLNAMAEMTETNIRQTTDSYMQASDALQADLKSVLSSIQSNTKEGSEAIHLAGQSVEAAASRFKSDITEASHAGRLVIEGEIETSGQAARAAITDAGTIMLNQLSETALHLQGRTTELSDAFGEQLANPLNQLRDQLHMINDQLTKTSEEIGALSGALSESVDASFKASDHFVEASQTLQKAAQPIQTSMKQLDHNIDAFQKTTERSAGIIQEGATITVTSAQEALASAQSILEGERGSVQAVLQELSAMIVHMQEQGNRMDNMDEKLASAMVQYNIQVNEALERLSGHTNQMARELDPALATMQSIVEQAATYLPQSEARLS